MKILMKNIMMESKKIYFLETIKKNMINSFFKTMRKNIRNFFKLGTWKFLPEI